MSEIREKGVPDIGLPCLGPTLSMVNVSTADGTTGTVHVEGTASDGSQGPSAAKAMIYRKNAPVDPSPPVGATTLQLNGTEFYSDTNGVPGAVASKTGDPDNKVVVWAMFTDWDSKVQEFVGQSQPFTSSVDGTACIWFAFAPAGEEGPYKENVDTHSPVRLAIPCGATKVDISATGRWRHQTNPPLESGPEGRGVAAKDPDEKGYKAEKYNSLNISHAPGDLNELTGLWDMGSGATTEVVIGAGKTNLAIELGAVALFLGLKDGHEWNNNSGKVDVTVKWKL